ncbi:Nuclease-related domain protein [Actinomadura rubteroloni]|uniref:Nuclease-related domain protein n=1 Tax=Actinomadura rubteroloni TaxID=1926885 RepID=A0A2P4URR8_9ACTN|nr:nuclease-related domain-containing protein [Actinomadura rubteroloni]POM27743.1 Nuclease-related domain protein [Actinomadura rubteroloni]
MAISEHDEAQQPADASPAEEAPAKGRPPRTFRDVLTSRRTITWIRRAAIGVVVAVIVSALVNARIGITVGVLYVLWDAVRRGRRPTSSVAAWQKSSAVERKTEKQLRTLERNGYRVLHARAVPLDEEGVSDGRIDHLVIGPSGVYAIDSEKWDSRLPIRTGSHLKLYHGPFDKKDRLDEARWEAEQASKTLSGQVGFEVPVQPSVAIYGPSIPWKVMRVRDVDVYSGTHARRYLRRRPTILTEADVQRIYAAAENSLPPKYPEES